MGCRQKRRSACPIFRSDLIEDLLTLVFAAEFTEAEILKLENVIQHGGDDIYSACPVPPPKGFRVDAEMTQNAGAQL